MKAALLCAPVALCAVFMAGVEHHPTSAIMANGKPFNPAAMTVAHKSLAFGTRVRFQLGPRSIIATVTDRGPFVAGREFDLSSGAFAKLAQVEAGLIRPKWRIVE